MTIEQPLFMNNEKWYYYDNKEEKYMLTQEAPPEAVKSHEEFYRLVDNELY